MADFGKELSCVSDVAEDGRQVTGNRLVAEAIVRRWQTPRGRLIRYPNYGRDLTDFLNDDVSPSDIAQMRSEAEQEAEKDERVTSCAVLAVLNVDGGLEMTAEVTTGDGPFELVVSITQVSVELLSP